MSVVTRAEPAVSALRVPRTWAVVLTAFVATRALVWITGAIAHASRGDQARIAAFDPGSLTRPFAGGAGDHLVAPFAAWDSVWYLVIANDAYAGRGPREAFFPLYPVLVDLVGVAIGPPVLAGILVSAACSVVALVVVHRLAELELGQGAADRAVWALLLFPVSFFLTAVYGESLFLALSAGAVLAARTDRWGCAGVLAALSSATRSAGIVVALALLLVWWSGARRPRDLAAIALTPLGLLAFCGGLALAGEDPLAPLTAQSEWYREFAGPFVGAYDGAVAAARFDDTHDVLLFATLLAVVPALIGAFRRLPPAHGAYALAALALPLSWPVEPQPLMSLPRFVLVLFPLFLWLGWWLERGGRWRTVLVLGPSAAGLVACTALFATWHWVA